MQGLLYEALVAERIEDRNRRAAQHYRASKARRRRRMPSTRLLAGLLWWDPRAG
jgi:hypothetical protein